MDSADNVLDSRLANALIPDASASPEAMTAIGQFVADATVVAQPAVDVAPFMSRLFPRLMSRELDWFKKRQRGLWVGGKVILSTKRLTFVANAMNEALHSAPDQLNWSVLLADIAAMQVRRGIITDIINVRTPSARHALRCFRAKAFAVKIEEARLAQG